MKNRNKKFLIKGCGKASCSHNKFDDRTFMTYRFERAEQLPHFERDYATRRARLNSALEELECAGTGHRMTGNQEEWSKVKVVISLPGKVDNSKFPSPTAVAAVVDNELRLGWELWRVQRATDVVNNFITNVEAEAETAAKVACRYAQRLAALEAEVKAEYRAVALPAAIKASRPTYGGDAAMPEIFGSEAEENGVVGIALDMLRDATDRGLELGRLGKGHRKPLVSKADVAPAMTDN